jgi:dephospho-CoA kinase
MMFLLGLTGSIGMGKSATAGMFREQGIPVNDADAVVHDLYTGEAAPLIEAAFPGAVVSGVVDRARLSSMLAENPDGFKRLEAIVHPLVRQKELEFRQSAELAGADIAVLDIPLLFEAGGEKRLDAVVVVSADSDIQRQRVLARPGMTVEKFEMILSRQVPDKEKRERADYIVETGSGFDNARMQVKAIIADIRSKLGQ